MKNRFLSNFVIGIIGQGGIQAIGLVTMMFLARGLNQSDFGAIAFGITLVGYINLFTDQGITTYGVKKVAKTDDINVVINVSVIRIVLAIMAIIIVIGFLYGSENKNKEIVSIYILCVLPAAINTQWVFNSKEKYPKYFSGMIIGKSALLILIVVISDMTAKEFSVFMILSEIISACIYYYLIKNEKFEIWKRNKLRIKKLTNVFVSNFSVGILIVNEYFLSYIFLLVVGIVGLPDALAELTVAHRSAFLFILPAINITTLVVIPKLSKIKSRTDLKNKTYRYMYISIIFCAIYTLGYLLYGPDIVRIIFSNKYAENQWIDYLSVLAAIKIVTVIPWVLSLVLGGKVIDRAKLAKFATELADVNRAVILFQDTYMG